MVLSTRSEHFKHITACKFIKDFARQKPGTLSVARNVIAADGIKGLWRGTTPSLFRSAAFKTRTLSILTTYLDRNVPGVAMYMTSLTQIRTVMARSAYFVAQPTALSSNGNGKGKGSVLPKLTTQGNLIAGGLTRVSVGFVLNPFSVLKARFEVRRVGFQLRKA